MHLLLRVAKIFNETNDTIENWTWIPSEMNIADLATKDNDKIDWKQWLEVLKFLLQHEEDWHIQKMPDMNRQEAISFHQEVTDNIFLGVSIKQALSKCVPKLDRFSNFNRLIRATAYTLKIVKNLEMAKNKRPPQLVIDIADLRKARKLWYQIVQHEVYGDEINDLKAHKFVRKSSPLYTHSPFLHEGFLRLQGRVQDSNANFDETNPIILPGKHPFTFLLIKFYHEQNLHGGVATVINNLRVNFDIIRCRNSVKRVFSSLLKFRILRARPKTPEMGDLPLERTTAFVNSISIHRNRLFWSSYCDCRTLTREAIDRFVYLYDNPCLSCRSRLFTFN